MSKKLICAVLALCMLISCAVVGSFASDAASGVLIGDANLNSKITVSDATEVQLHAAGMKTLTGDYATAADVDKDGNIDVNDATLIQYYIIEVERSGSYCGIYSGEDPTDPIVTTAPVTTAPVTTVPVTTAPSDTYTVKFTNSLSWSGTIKCYYWGDSAAAPFDWNSAPAMSVYQQSNDYGQTVYTIDIPNQYNNVIFTNGSVQTVDINTGSVSTNYYAKDTQSGGKYEVGTWVEGDEPDVTNPESTYTVKFTNSLNWSGTIKCYYWGDSASAPFDWNSAPAMSVDTQDNGYGQTVYTITIPTQYNNVIFTNGSVQTVDINTLSVSTNYYAMDTQTNGHYNVGTWS